MDPCSKYLLSATDRKNSYTLFARICRLEVDDDLLAALRELSFLERGESALFSEALAEMKAYLRDPGIDPKMDLAVDYARIFLGVGVAKNDFVAPLESAYVNASRESACKQVAAIYQRQGLAIEGIRGDSEDHIAFELDFMAYLVGQGASLADARDAKVLLANIDEQAAFLNDHLINWIHRFSLNAARVAETAFYRAVVKMIAEYIALDKQLVDWLSVEMGNELLRKD